jgi:hypothetical protein
MVSAEPSAGQPEQSQVSHLRSSLLRQPLADLANYGMIESKVVPHGISWVQSWSSTLSYQMLRATFGLLNQSENSQIEK